MSKVDLDAIYAVQTRDGRLTRAMAEALVAELRAARDVIDITRYADAPGLRAAIHAYDKVTGEST